jgi:hypothetical protein
MYMYDSIMRILVKSSDGPSSRISSDTKQIYTTRRYKKRKGGAKVIRRRNSQAAVLFQNKETNIRQD